MQRKEVKEPEEAKEAKDEDARVAAFFDLDGTLMARPSMEKRFFKMLRYRRLVGIRNYFWWLLEAVRLAPRGVNQIMHANKMYLWGVRVDEACCGTDIRARLRARNKAGKNGERRRQARMPVPPFYPEAIERVMWHAERGHGIVLVSGTLEPLAKKAALDLEEELAWRGINASIEICATRLETIEGRWTGRIIGEAMCGEEKTCAIRRFAAASEIELSRCFAYGDSANDRWMLEAVGRPTAVNPSSDLARIAARNGWPILRWNGGRISMPSSQCSQKTPNAKAIRKEMESSTARLGEWS